MPFSPLLWKFYAFLPTTATRPNRFPSVPLLRNHGSKSLPFKILKTIAFPLPQKKTPFGHTCGSFRANPSPQHPFPYVPLPGLPHLNGQTPGRKKKISGRQNLPETDFIVPRFA